MPTCLSTRCNKRKDLVDGYCRDCATLLANVNSEKTWPCGVCPKAVLEREMAMCCDSCSIWSHIACINMPETTYEVLTSKSECIEGVNWYCSKCRPKVAEAIEKLTTLEKRTETLESKVTDVETKIDKISEQVSRIVHTEITETMQEKSEIDQRKLNLIVYGLPEVQETAWDTQQKIEADTETVENLVKNELGVGLGPRKGIVDCRRLGKSIDNGARPLRIVFSDLGTKRDVLFNAKKLRQSDDVIAKKVYINPDLTPKQRLAEKTLRDEMWARRNKGEKVIIQKGKIVPTDRDVQMTRKVTKTTPVADGTNPN